MTTDRLKQTIVMHFFNWRAVRSPKTIVRVEDGVTYVYCDRVMDRIVVTEGSEMVIWTGPINADILQYKVTIEGTELD